MGRRAIGGTSKPSLQLCAKLMQMRPAASAASNDISVVKTTASNPGFFILPGKPIVSLCFPSAAHQGAPAAPVQIQREPFIRKSQIKPVRKSQIESVRKSQIESSVLLAAQGYLLNQLYESTLTPLLNGRMEHLSFCRKNLLFPYVFHRPHTLLKSMRFHRARRLFRARAMFGICCENHLFSLCF